MPDALRVLVVDDNADDFELMLLQLRRAGFEPIAQRVETADEMRDALAMSWHVVLVDWCLPRFDAPSALEMLAQLRQPPPCIVVSGVGGEDKAVLAVKLGACDFVRKDRLERLPEAVRAELLVREGRDE